MRCLRCPETIRPGGLYCHACGQRRPSGILGTGFMMLIFVIALPFMLFKSVLESSHEILSPQLVEPGEGVGLDWGEIIKRGQGDGKDYFYTQYDGPFSY